MRYLLVLVLQGVTLCDFLVFGQPLNIGKIVLIFTLLAGVVGLKLATTSEKGA
jgi:paired small multidrug resistance pump